VHTLECQLAEATRLSGLRVHFAASVFDEGSPTMAVDLDGALPDEAFALGVTVADWRAAIRVAGERLVASGATTTAYADEMIRTVETLGPYIVIAPGIALAHSRPSPAVLRTGLSWVHLASPVEFGNAQNDPVSLVIGLAALDHDSHLAVLAAVAAALSDPARLRALDAAKTPTAVRDILAQASSTTDQYTDREQGS
jgi:PTS system ascorbate-specific IIA component